MSTVRTISENVSECESLYASMVVGDSVVLLPDCVSESTTLQKSHDLLFLGLCSALVTIISRFCSHVQAYQLKF